MIWIFNMIMTMNQIILKIIIVNHQKNYQMKMMIIKKLKKNYQKMKKLMKMLMKVIKMIMKLIMMMMIKKLIMMMIMKMKMIMMKIMIMMMMKLMMIMMKVNHQKMKMNVAILQMKYQIKTNCHFIIIIMNLLLILKILQLQHYFVSCKNIISLQMHMKILLKLFIILNLYLLM